MPYVVTQSAIEPFADALLAVLRGDTEATTAGTLAALLGGADQLTTRIAASLRSATRTAPPYITASRRRYADGDGAAAMGIDGGSVAVWLQFWSDQNSPHEVQALMSRVHVLLPRDRVLAVPGFAVFGGSLVCEEDVVEPDFDEDMPQRSLFRGEQQWTALIEAV